MAAQSVKGLLPANSSKASILNLWLSGTQADVLKKHLALDSQSYYYSALVSFLDGCAGLSREVYSWSTVKLYYSAFYSSRALLASGGHCVFYFKDKPFSCQAAAGKSTSSLKGTTHKAVLDLFGKVFRSDVLLSQDIAGERPFDWLINRREDASYRQARFSDPTAPPHFTKIAELGFRKAVNEYLDDRTLLYVFDADHAMVAFPLALLVRARAKLVESTLPYDDLETRFLSGLGRDRNGRIASLAGLL